MSADVGWACLALGLVLEFLESAAGLLVHVARDLIVDGEERRAVHHGAAREPHGARGTKSEHSVLKFDACKRALSLPGGLFSFGDT